MMITISTRVKDRVRGWVGTAELIRRMQAIESVLPRDEAASGGRPNDARVEALEEVVRQREASIRQTCTVAVKKTMMQASEDAFFQTILNGAEVLLPRETIRTMLHCVHGRLEGPPLIHIEEAHLRWMMSHMAEGGTFLDVGSATGATTIPMVVTFGSAIRIVAFEPARKARRLLELTLARNALDGVEVVPEAVSNSVGQATFSEYGHDETGMVPFLPEASSIHTPLIDEARSVKYEVDVTTLDVFCSGRGPLTGPVVIKIDVEGFECHVLEGASALISSARPWFSIDIHKDPFGDGTTEAKVRALLAVRGYEFESMGHVLLASPRG